MENVSLHKSHVIAVCGGSCSGKTTMVNKLYSLLGEDNCSVVFQDSYYLGLSSITNYDHIDSIDFDLMRDHIVSLKKGMSIDMPCYDFVTHKRKPQTVKLKPKPIILVDGILILASSLLRECFDLKVFVECDESVRRERRITRDVAERGRMHEEVLHQFDTQVVPAHNQFVEPSKEYADYVVAQASCKEEDDEFLGFLENYCKNVIHHTEAV